MRTGKYGRDVSLRDAISDIISEALPCGTDEEKAVTDGFTNSKTFDRMLDDILSEIDEHVEYNTNKLSEEVTK